MTRRKLTDIIERETNGETFRVDKYGLDSFFYREDDGTNESIFNDESINNRVWLQIAESSQESKYINLRALSKKISLSDTQILTYFIDGSRRVYKIDDIAYTHSGGEKIKNVYPIMAGQIGVACCKRSDKKMSPFKFIREIVIVLPDIAISQNRSSKNFRASLTRKLNDSLSGNLKISAVLTYSTAQGRTSFEERGKNRVQSRMIDYEISLTNYLAEKKLLSVKNFLVKDGPIQYIQSKNIAIPNYRYVLGIAKNFDPEVCINPYGMSEPGYIAELPLYHRTQAALFTNPGILGDRKFAVWYLRIHDRIQGRSAFDGVIKLEKMLSTKQEISRGYIDSQEINILSAYIINERSPVCYGNDSRWPSHIYPVYLTEQYAKSKYISTENFLQLF